MIICLKGMYSEMDVIKNEIIKIVDEKSKISLLREIERMNVNVDDSDLISIYNII